MSIKKLVFVLFIFCSSTGLIWGKEDPPHQWRRVGAIVPSAIVTLRNEATGVVVGANTDAAGAYLFELLNPGLHSLQIQATGFKQFHVQHIRLEVAGRVGVNAKLELGEHTEVVTATYSGGASTSY